MSSFPFNPLVKRCPKGHPIDNDEPCGYCKQEDALQAIRDDKLLEQLKRLVERGKVSPRLLANKD